MRAIILWSLFVGAVLLIPAVAFLKHCERELWAEVPHGFVLVKNEPVATSERFVKLNYGQQETFNPQKAETLRALEVFYKQD